MNILIRLLAFSCLLGAGPAIITYWHYTQGFVWSDPQWWRWLGYEMLAGAGVPPEFLYPAYIIGGLMVGLGVLILFVGARSGAVTLAGGRAIAESHGTAAFASSWNIRRMGLYEPKGIVVGGYKGRRLYDNGPTHALVFAPTRSGKGVSLVIPTLLTWQGSVMVYDIKGENFALTAGHRAKMGQRIVMFKPSAESGSARYNPLGEVRVGTGNEIGDVQTIANMIVDPDGKGMTGPDSHWTKSAYSWLSAVILHVIYRARLLQEREANMSDVLSLLASGRIIGEESPEDEQSGQDFDKEIDAETDSGEAQFVAILDDMMAFDHDNDQVDRFVHNGASSMRKKADKERASINSSAEVPLSLYADPVVTRNISCCDFRIRDMMNSEDPVSLYVVVPPNQRERLKPLLRLMFDQYVNQLTAEMEFADGATKATYKHRLLVLLDEFTSLGKMETIQTALAYSAGYGVKFMLIVQDMEQLRGIYGREEAISGNSHIRVAFAPNTHETAKLLSDLCGETTIVTRRTSVSRGSGFGAAKSITESTQESGRPLMTPDEMRRMPLIHKSIFGRVKPGKVLVLIAGQEPIYGDQVLYFQDKEQSVAAKLPPVLSAIPYDPPSSLSLQDAAE